MSKTIGIDLGTTNSCMAVLVDGQPVIIPNAEGERTTPSVVAFTKAGQRLIGTPAKQPQLTNPQGTLASIKRFMGRQWEEVSEEMAIVAYPVEKGDRGDVNISVEGVCYTPQEISAMILQKLKADAEAYLGECVTQAVITVPAFFNDDQRKATRDAGRIAGLNVLRIINEPTAASLAYGLDKAEDQTVLVFDLGGGTFDVSILSLGAGLFEVKATSGDNHLGGDNFDKAIVDWLLGELNREQGLDLAADPIALSRLYAAAEKAKIELSSMPTTLVKLPFITATPAGAKHLSLELTRVQLNALSAALIARTTAPILQALADAGLKACEIDQVVLVGGMTRMPAVQDKIRELIDKEPHQNINPDEVVAMGAAVQAGVLLGEIKDVLLLDVTSLSLGIETKGGVFTRLIERNTSIPTRKTQTFTTAEDNQCLMEINVLQGESEMAVFNKSLGIFLLDDLPPVRRGLLEIDVTFDIDANGIIHVEAQDIATGNEQQIQIEGGSGLTEDEISHMVKSAEAYANVAHRLRELADVRNHAEVLAAEIELSLNKFYSQIKASEASLITQRIADLRQVIKAVDAREIRTRTEALVAAAQVLRHEGQAEETEQPDEFLGCTR
ncbi:Chaperone protein DnaK [Polaromonas vacuolata]|uniref:Chaperone protein DnaK n=1 Tax=Polaromonas vacuolata TaxID=37448 RepID=A0A6H2HAH1_9BURK|nr:molecular chaperone DnaK [Polaromonas vacuolata]QJC56594.1 Chaperone protein DnaK [Polaromonas vacuolata]